MNQRQDKENSRRRGLDNPANVTRLFHLLAVLCAALLIFDLFDLSGLLYHKHVHYEVEHWFGFYPLFGFLAYSFIVFAGHLWRRVVMRGEDYYGD